VEAALGQILFFTGQRDAAHDHIERAVTLATELELPVLAPALMIQGYLLSADGDIKAAEAAMATAVEVAHHHGKSVTELGARSNLGELRFTSDLPGAEQECRSALDLAGRMGFGYGQSHAYADLAIMSFVSGRWHDAMTLAEQGIAVAPDPLTRGHARLPLILVHSAQGQTTPAAEQLAEMEPLSSSDDTQDVGVLEIARAANALNEGQLAKALTAAASAAEAASKAYGVRTAGFRLAWPLALKAATASGRLHRVRTLLELIADPSPGQVPLYLEAEYVRFRALLDAANGVHDAVEADLRHAITILADLGFPYWLAQTQADLARWLVSQDRATEAQPLVADAIETFTRLGAQPDLDAALGLVPTVDEAG